MGAGHSHAPATGHAGGRYRRRLAGAFALTAGFFLIELVAGLVPAPPHPRHAHPPPCTIGKTCKRGGD